VTGFHHRIFQNHSSGGNDAKGLNHRMVHDNGSHTYQYVMVQGAAVNDGIVTDTALITYGGRSFLVSAMDHGTVLDVDTVSNTDAVHVTPYNGIEPEAAPVTGDDITDDGGILSNKTIFT
jgi:hypothetical protein